MGSVFGQIGLNEQRRPRSNIIKVVLSFLILFQRKKMFSYCKKTNI